MSQVDFKALFAIVNVPLLVLDEEFLIVAFNAAYIKATGIRENESLGRSVLDVFPDNPNDASGTGRSDLRISLNKVLKTGVVDEMPIVKYDVPLRDSATGEFEERFWKAVNAPVFNSEGRVTHILHRAEDVTTVMQVQNRNLKLQVGQQELTALRIAQADLTFERHKLETIFQETPAAMALWRGQDFIFEKANPQYQAIFPDRDLVGKPFLEACPEFVGQPFFGYLKRVFETGEPYIGKEEYAPLRPKKDGPLEDRYYDFTYLRINDAEGRPYGVYDHAIDVTYKVKARKALEFEQLKLKTVIENSTASIAVLRGESFIYEITNKSYAELFNNRELIGRPLLEALPELRDQPFPKHAKSVFETGVPYIEREALALLKRTEDSPIEERYFDQTYSRILDHGGKPYGIFMHAQEVTDRVRARRDLSDAKERAELASAAKSAFVANMSHEIRTPLAAIIGFSNLLKDRDLGADEKGYYVDTIVRNGNALTRIIDDILDLAKVEAGKLDIEIVPFSLYTLVTDAVDLFKDKAKEKDIYLVLNIEDTVPTRICSDPTRLRQILVNLVGNAVKFTDKGGVRVNVRSANLDGNRAKITIEVRDTGIGLEPEQKERLFKPFTQADNSMSRKFGGTGLGLALSQRLSKALSGKITISDCQPGKGCTFTLTFFGNLAEGLNTDPALKETPEKSNSLKGLRILVVDDSPDNQFLVARLLRKNGAIVETALDGREGCKKAISDSFDVILMDIQMPNMDGYQAKQALDQHGYTKPIIALTAHAMAEERVKTSAAGFAGHLTKPLIASDLLRTVASVGDVSN